MIKRQRSRVACVGVLLAVVAWSALGSELSVGGRGVFLGSALPSVAGSAEIDLFARLGSLEVSSRTEMSLFPYTTGDQTIAVSLIRDWVSLSAEYRFSVMPLGITTAKILAQVMPPAWLASWGSFVIDASVEGEARLLGYGFASTPLRAELWAKGAAGIGSNLGMLDFVRVAATLEGTLSAPSGTIWPTPGLVASASLGPATLASETQFSLAGGMHIESETVSLACSWRELGFSAKAWCTFSDDPAGPSVGLRIAYEFGAAPLRPFPDSTACVGGVCH